MSDAVTGGPSTSPVPARRRLSRDPGLDVAGLVDVAVARSLWDSLPAECRRDHFDQGNLPQRYRGAVLPASSGSQSHWQSVALNMRGLPEAVTWELAWLIYREVKLGRSVSVNNFGCAARVLRAATGAGGPPGRAAASVLSLTPSEWLRQAQRARLAGADLGRSNDEHAFYALQRWQDLLVHVYHRGPWWTLDLWNPALDPRIPRRQHEPMGRSVANFGHLHTPWLRESAKWWLSTCLETERYTWTSLKTRLHGLKWLQRHLDAYGDQGPQLVEDSERLRAFSRAFVQSLRTHMVTVGATKDQPLGPVARRQTIGTVEAYYQFMHDHRDDAAAVLAEPRWRSLGPGHAVLFRPEDKPRHTNRLSQDMVLDDDVLTQIAQGAELLAAPRGAGGYGDVQAFHALMLLLRTGRRVNEVLMMDFDPLLPLVGAGAVTAPSSAADDGALIARMRYQQTKTFSGQPAVIPVDAEIVAVVRAQQQWARAFLADQDLPAGDPKYLFPAQRVNRFGDLPYPSATLHAALGWLADRLQIRDSQGREVRISKTHKFRHTRATNLLNAGVPIHVVMRHFGHVTPTMTMHYAQTLSATAEREFLRYQKVTASGRPLQTDAGDLYDVMALEQRADRILPNGWCMLPPKQTCSRGNACLTCDKFVTDVSHHDELQQQLTQTDALIDLRQQAFEDRYGSPMPANNVWLTERRTERAALQQILVAVDQVKLRPGAAPVVRGAGSPESRKASGELS